jgi:NTP pyrophosphatase (non-canonical NTP hydrolase)
VLEKCLLLGEEVGELFKTIRKATGMSVDTRTAVSPVADELADVLIMLCSIANRAGVDLDAAFRAKEEKNRERTWR